MSMGSVTNFRAPKRNPSQLYTPLGRMTRFWIIPWFNRVILYSYSDHDVIIKLLSSTDNYRYKQEIHR